jgi:hypothetical protein
MRGIGLQNGLADWFAGWLVLCRQKFLFCTIIDLAIPLLARRSSEHCVEILM